MVALAGAANVADVCLTGCLLLWYNEYHFEFLTEWLGCIVAIEKLKTFVASVGQRIKSSLSSAWGAVKNFLSKLTRAHYDGLMVSFAILSWVVLLVIYFLSVAVAVTMVFQIIFFISTTCFVLGYVFCRDKSKSFPECMSSLYSAAGSSCMLLIMLGSLFFPTLLPALLIHFLCLIPEIMWVVVRMKQKVEFVDLDNGVDKVRWVRWGFAAVLSVLANMALLSLLMMPAMLHFYAVVSWVFVVLTILAYSIFFLILRVTAFQLLQECGSQNKAVRSDSLADYLMSFVPTNGEEIIVEVSVDNAPNSI